MVATHVYRCGFEMGWEQYQSVLCGELAAVLINRLNFGRVAYCESHYNQENASPTFVSYGIIRLNRGTHG